MKRLIALLLVLCTLTLCLTGCSARKITVDDWIRDYWLYEDMENRYGIGEHVSVKIQSKEGVGCWLILRGKGYNEVVHHSSSTDEYLQFEFTMPEVNIELDLMIVPTSEDG